MHFEARKTGMRGLTDAEIPNLREVFAKDWPSIAPLVVLLVVLFHGLHALSRSLLGHHRLPVGARGALAAATALALIAVIGFAAPTELLRTPGVNAALASQPSPSAPMAC